MSDLPVIGMMIGDPAGIGPEVCVRTAAASELAGLCRPVLVGDLGVVHRAARVCGLSARFEAVTDPAQQLPVGTIGVVDPGGFDVSTCAFGKASAASGNAVLGWIERGEALGRQRSLQALVMGPVESASLKATGRVQDIDELQPAGTFMLRMSGKLRVVPLTEHVPLTEAVAAATPERVFQVIEMANASLRKWGFERPRIAVAGINPHAMFPQDQERIAPAVARAQAQGIAAQGPLVPDAVFRQCVQGQWDVVVTMYHDQGQIPIKTVGFEGACTVYIGLPFVMLNVPHGTAYDIAGRGVAQHQSMLSAVKTAAALATGRPLATD
ncbi:4-hydroxythreonine-4-phosphate dehydrogenase PdxA [Ramlibacter sp. AW1]|uniref:4-hydroxythreonine-4-phosphate dehydrogenase PdxA n=1 Tax=Ramlibacter aurantiacus TaxID=2801330 RepID=A0A937D8U0_9BURK|nr:4-hydroxythreonine-4-phosphate dehydrogenase PdxA [Ramlibacter aurantiacus]MBL0422436.1 4-hydroxythreonine-4-phosphate dehydrogenase PdxA [Ramlibacter aurantiacus]